MSSASERPTHFERAALASAVVMAGLVMLRALVQVVPTLWFDVDPAVDPWPAGWGPAHTLALDSLTLALAGFVYAACMQRAARADALVAVAALVPACAVLLHGLASADDQWRGTGWLAAMVASAALWTAVRSLPRGAALRAALVAVLIASAGPLLLRSGMQVLFEHGATVANYQETKAATLAARGWAPDSPQALMFERRLLQVEATGWFGLSNVLSSLCAAMAIAAMGLAIAGWRNLERGTTLLLGLAALGCTAVVIVNGSRGAIGALAIGAVVASIAAWQRRRPFVGSVLGVCAVGASIAAVVARGVAGESLGERSLLFRWHYIQGAVKAWLADPLLGTGPARFAEAYLLTRPDRAPEEVLSAHSMWADWLAALGIAALPWVALVLAWVWLAGRMHGAPAPSVRAEDDSIAAPASPGRRFVLVALAVTLGACVTGAAVEIQSLDVEGLIARSVGAALALALVIAVVQALELPSRAAAAGLFGAVVALAVHAQIEMTMWSAGSVGWVLAFIAVVAANPTQPARGRLFGTTGVVALCALACVVLSGLSFAWGAVPAAMETRRMSRAAEPLVALHDHAKGSAREVSADVRLEAARVLADDSTILAPWADRPLRLAASLDQLAAALGATNPASPEFDAMARAALASAEAVVRRASSPATLSGAQVVAMHCARSADAAVQAEAYTALLKYATQQVAGSPRSVGAWVRLGRASEALGLAESAREAYRRALAADDSFALDPIRQLSPADREALTRLAQEPAQPPPQEPAQPQP